jgi:hypothetical protein
MTCIAQHIGSTILALRTYFVTFAVPDAFETYDGAIEAGLAAAQKWIDGGKQAI